MIKLSLAWVMIAWTGVSWLSGTSRSFFIHLLIHFWWCTLNTECNFVTQKRRSFELLSRYFSTLLRRNQNSTFYYCDLPSFTTAQKIHLKLKQTWVTCFPLSAQRPSASPDAVVWLSVSILLFTVHLSEPNTGFHSLDSRILHCDLTLIGANGFMHIYLLSHLYCKWQNGGQSGEKSWDEFRLRISLWNCDPAHYLNSNVKSAVKGHKDTAEICELQTANWCLTSEPPEAKLHTYWAHITFDIRWRWHPGISAELHFTQLLPKKKSQRVLCSVLAFIFWCLIISYHIFERQRLSQNCSGHRFI